MDHTAIFLISIGLVVLITCLAIPQLPSKEHFTVCENNPYRPINMETLKSKKKVRFASDLIPLEPLESQLVPRVTKHPEEIQNWKSYYLNRFEKGSVETDTNFEGTQVKNYLDSINFFHN